MTRFGCVGARQAAQRSGPAYCRGSLTCWRAAIFGSISTRWGTSTPANWPILIANGIFAITAPLSNVLATAELRAGTGLGHDAKRRAGALRVRELLSRQNAPRQLSTGSVRQVEVSVLEDLRVTPWPAA